MNVAMAAVDSAKFGSVINPILATIVEPLIYFAFFIAVIYFFVGVGTLIWGSPDKRKQGKDSILWGIVGMFIMLSAWGIVYLISNTIKGFS